MDALVNASALVASPILREVGDFLASWREEMLQVGMGSVRCSIMVGFGVCFTSYLS